MRKITNIILILFITICLTGCIKRDNMEGITIYTTNYPSEYITKRLYGSFSKVKSIYPDGVNINNYKLTNKQLTDYSNSDLFIFNGLNNEKNYVTKMRKNNKNLKIIDTTLSMEYDNSIEQLWLDPSNFLMMAQNVKTGLNEYIDSYYLRNKINENYEKLKIEASNLDAKMKEIVTSASSKSIVVSSNTFKYLEKYGLKVYSLDEKNSDVNVTYKEVLKLINKGDIKYIFIKSNDKTNRYVQSLQKQTNVTVQSWHTLSNLSEIERSEKKDYFSIMNNNLELLKNELYK
ncbi:MAG: metal ABC transporter substrate-binding protein [Bacilli bacterium]|nr:metal ABC transporter substrate-binding protein [Bacilli bacterium]